MEEKCEISIGCGYKYIIKNKDKDDITMVEYHVDNSILFQEKLSNTKFGGNLSVRKPSNIKPLLMFGQDECIKEHGRRYKDEPHAVRKSC